MLFNDDFRIGRSGVSSDFFLNNAGNIGIGTAAPSTKLDVAGDIKISGASPTFRFDDNNNDGVFIHNNFDILYFMRDNNRNDTWDDGDDDRSEFGLMDSNGQWTVRASRDSHVELRDNNEVTFRAG